MKIRIENLELLEGITEVIPDKPNYTKAELVEIISKKAKKFIEQNDNFIIFETR